MTGTFLPLLSCPTCSAVSGWEGHSECAGDDTPEEKETVGVFWCGEGEQNQGF